MERELPARKVTAIHVDLMARSVTVDLEGEGEALVVIEEGDLAIGGTPIEAEGVVDPEAGAAAENGAKPEGETAVVMTGHLRAVPREGRPDRNGKPTAWAPFLGKAEDEEQARAYSATFYRAAAPIVLSLGKGANLTVRGFIRPSTDPDNNDWLSVVGILNYPGKPSGQPPADEGST